MERQLLQENMWRFARALRQVERGLREKAWQEAEDAAGQGQSWFGGCDEEIEDAREVAQGAARETVRLLAEDVDLPLTINRQELSDACMAVRHDDFRDVVSLIKVIDRAALVLTKPKRVDPSSRSSCQYSRKAEDRSDDDALPSVSEAAFLPGLRWADDFSVVILNDKSYSFRGAQTYAIKYIIDLSLQFKGSFDVSIDGVLEHVEDREARDRGGVEPLRLRDLFKSAGAYGKGKLVVPGSRRGMVRLNIDLPTRSPRRS